MTPGWWIGPGSEAQLRRSLSCLLSGLLIIAAMALGFHRHADGAPHADCPTCITAQFQSVMVADPPSGLVCPPLGVLTRVDHSPLSANSPARTSIRGRAPPR